MAAIFFRSNFSKIFLSMDAPLIVYHFLYRQAFIKRTLRKSLTASKKLRKYAG